MGIPPRFVGFCPSIAPSLCWALRANILQLAEATPLTSGGSPIFHSPEDGPRRRFAHLLGCCCILFAAFDWLWLFYSIRVLGFRLVSTTLHFLVSLSSRCDWLFDVSCRSWLRSGLSRQQFSNCSKMLVGVGVRRLYTTSPIMCQRLLVVLSIMASCQPFPIIWFCSLSSDQQFRCRTPTHRQLWFTFET